MKPWREVAVPHKDVLEGRLQQADFAADIGAVKRGVSTREYQDATAFFQRTYITDGMRRLLTQVAQRLGGHGGEPVIQLQTAFGGGKTHTMLAVYHLATRAVPLKELAGIPALLDQARLLDVPRANVAVLDGTAHGPGTPWKHGDRTIRTLWGELGWQLGREDGYAIVRDADESGTSPGKHALEALLRTYAPCVVLVDELVAYVRQFSDGDKLSGGTYDSNLSFVQALTEATKLVPNAVLLASLPESEIEAGSQRGQGALRALEKTFGRVQAVWKPVATEEAFEIVRRRLFEPITDRAAIETTCRAFAKLYGDEGAKVPSETHEGRYFDRLTQAYPIHPEVFDRLYEDWSTLETFQRTRGVLKLMARVVARSWDDKEPLILPADLPLADADVRNELLGYLPQGWDPVVERDIDGARAETTSLDRREPRFGAIKAAVRVARTIFLASAPSSAGTSKRIRGLDRARVLLGCLVPEQSSALYADALSRLVDRLHYLNASGDKTSESTRYWFDTRATLRREMEDRKGRFDDSSEVRAAIARELKRLSPGGSLFAGAHVFSPHGDVGDDSALRLVFLPPEAAYAKHDTKPASDAVIEYVRNHGAQPRHRGNRLLFVAADHAALGRLGDVVRTALAWRSIVEDIDESRLNVDKLQADQAKKEMAAAEKVIPRAARECWRFLLCPVMHAPTDREITVEAFPIGQGAGEYADEIARVCRDHELVIETWSPIHLREQLRQLYWKDEAPVVRAMTVWEDMQKYLYLPRLLGQHVLEQAIDQGASSTDFFGTAYGQTGERPGERYDGFHFGSGAPKLDSALLLIEPTAAAAYARRIAAPSGKPSPSVPVPAGSSQTNQPDPSPPTRLARSFSGSVDVKASKAKAQLIDIVDELIAHLVSDPDATVRLSLEVSAEFPSGAPEPLRRVVWENAGQLGFKHKAWE